MSFQQVLLVGTRSNEASLLDPLSGALLCAWRVPGAASMAIAPMTHAHPWILMSAPDKAVIHGCSFQSEQLQRRMVCNELITLLSSSPDGHHLAGGTASGRVYLWQVASGRCVTVQDVHYKALVALEWTDDGQVLVTAGEDGLVHAWLLNEPHLLPLHTWSHHTLAVTGLHITHGPWSMARVFTCSLDRTCRVYELQSGQLLKQFKVDTALTCLAVSTCESVLLAGGEDGWIYSTNLFDDATSLTAMTVAHSTPVKFIRFSLDDSSFVSASQDKLHFYHCHSRQLLRSMTLPSHVTHVQFLLRPFDLLQKGVTPVTMPLLQRTQESVLLDWPVEVTSHVRQDSNPIQMPDTHSLQLREARKQLSLIVQRLKHEREINMR